MIKNLLIFCVLLISTQTFAQKEFRTTDKRPTLIAEEHYQFSNQDFTEANAVPVLLQKLAKHSQIGLEPNGEKNSKTGKHLYYQLTFNNLPIYNAQVVVRFNNNQSIDVTWPKVALGFGNEAVNPVDVKNLLAEYNALDYSDLGATLYLHNGQLLPSTQVNLHLMGSEVRHLVLYGDSIFVNTDLRRFNQDSTVTGYVFMPDPLTSANRNYGGLYVDNNDASNAALNNERVLVNFKANYNLGIFSLESSAVKMVEHDAPNVPPVTSALPVFSYQRHESGFEDVNCFYHINEFKFTIDSTGHTLPGFQVEADAHGVSGTDQSWYSPNIQKLSFGEGGVDDAEDPDVIVHEYGHAVVDGAVTGITSVPAERAMLEEAICDYFAVAYSRLYSSNQSNRVFNWDGHNEFWNGRMASSSKNYQQQNFSGSIYAHTDIIASCLSEIESNIGYSATLDVVLESLYRLTTNSTFVDFANSMVQSDQLLNAGGNYNVIVTAFQRRNILSADFSILETKGVHNNIELFGSMNFAQGGMATLRAEEKIGSYTLINSSGALLGKESGLESEIVELSASGLPAGVYILNVEAVNGVFKSFKLIRW